jgi:hypothetical protein
MEKMSNDNRLLKDELGTLKIKTQKKVNKKK